MQVSGHGNFGSLDDDPPAAMRWVVCNGLSDDLGGQQEVGRQMVCWELCWVCRVVVIDGAGGGKYV